MSSALNTIASRLLSAATFGYGLFTMLLYGLLAIRKGYFFKGPSEKENLELQLARDRLWNLSKEWNDSTHQFLTLSNGFRFHYLCNESTPETSKPATKPLIIFIHGFPDSWAVWRHIISSQSLQEAATVVAVDLPGYGGSDQLEKYTATEVLDNLANFIVGARARYGIDGEDIGVGVQRTVIVGHDWGCALSMRLASEASVLADRFVLSNGPLIGLAFSNARRLMNSSIKMFKTSIYSPIRSRSTLLKAIKTLKPVLIQTLLSGYIFVMLLPMAFVQYLGTGRNYSFLRLIHKGSYGKDNKIFTPQDAAECMASTLGPSQAECNTKTSSGEEYPTTVKNERALSNFHHMASYYRDGAVTRRWYKSVETVANLHTISQGNELRRASSGAGMFDESPAGVLKASSTIIWGKNDQALEPHLCLGGISDYMVGGSQVIQLPRSGHFTPIERESRVVLERVAEWAVNGEMGDVGKVVEGCYEKAVVTVRK